MAHQPAGSASTLSESESQRIFSEAIAPVITSRVGADRPVTPRVIMLGGQPGSGKTSRLRFPAEDELKGAGGFITIDADQLRTYHPQWEALSQEDDSTAAVLTQPDAAKWVSQAINLATREGCHVVFDGTMGSPESVMNRIQLFSDAGYQIDIRILAVDQHRSWLGVLRRYEEAKARIGTGRMTPRDVHNEAYDGLLKTLERIESIRPAVRIRLYSRDGTVVFDSESQSVHATAVEALQKERDRAWSPSEMQEFRDDVEQLTQVATKRGADQTTIEGYRALTGP